MKDRKEVKIKDYRQDKRYEPKGTDKEAYNKAIKSFYEAKFSTVVMIYAPTNQTVMYTVLSDDQKDGLLFMMELCLENKKSLNIVLHEGCHLEAENGVPSIKNLAHSERFIPYEVLFNSVITVTHYEPKKNEDEEEKDKRSIPFKQKEVRRDRAE